MTAQDLPAWMPLSVFIWIVQMIAYHGFGLWFEWLDRNGRLADYKVRPVDSWTYAQVLPRVLDGCAFVQSDPSGVAHVVEHCPGFPDHMSLDLSVGAGLAQSDGMPFTGDALVELVPLPLYPLELGTADADMEWSMALPGEAVACGGAPLRVFAGGEVRADRGGKLRQRGLVDPVPMTGLKGAGDNLVHAQHPALRLSRAASGRVVRLVVVEQGAEPPAETPALGGCRIVLFGRMCRLCCHAACFSFMIFRSRFKTSPASRI